MSRSAAVMSAVVEDRKWSTAEASRMREYMSRVAHSEAPQGWQSVQRSRNGGDGPGRGGFQFEMSAHGGSGAAAVARNRLKTFATDYNVDLTLTDEELEVFESDDPDFSKLPRDLQEAAFIANANYHPKMPMTDIANGEIEMADAYRKYHYAGPEVDRINKHWASAQADYDRRYNSMP